LEEEFNNPVSRFISDMGVDGVGYEDSVELISDFDISEHYIDESFEVGDRVKSNIFGIGEIVDVDGLAVTVNFDNGKSKKLNIEYARLEKRSHFRLLLLILSIIFMLIV